MRIDHEYMLHVKLKVIGAEEPDSAPVQHVTTAVRSLLLDNGYEWLLEAIGHPHPIDFEVEVVGLLPEGDS